MDYEKKYNEALERARQFSEHPLQEDSSNIVEYIFPELQESKDERIRESLLEYLHTLPNHYSHDGVCAPEWIAWLEKQGESYTKRDVDDAYVEGMAFAKNELKKQGEAFDKIAQRARTEKQRVLVTESDGVANIDWDTRSLQDAKQLMEYGLNYIKKIEKQGEQKPADKVEPKFHEGDWVVSKLGNVWYIDSFDNKNYKVTDINGNYNCFPIYIQDRLHLWTIQDAKDGDVLINWNNTTFIFKAIENETVKFHVAYNEKWDAIKTPSTKLSHLGLPEHQFEFHPATKEQRDTLMKAMTDAGYTFDFKKKELKKVEEEVNGEDYGIDGLYHAQRILEKTLGSVEGYQSDDGILDHKAAVTAVKKLYEQKPAWSEEDEDAIGMAIIALEDMYDEDAPNTTYGGYNLPFNKAAERLKSLKDRVQPKQEWKQENTDDLTDFENAMMHIGESFFSKNGGLDPNDTNVIKEQAKLLLELTNIHKWSEEDGEMLNLIIARLHSHPNVDLEEYSKEYNWLNYRFETIKPQSTWKPSEEQIDVIEAVMNNRSFQKRHLDSLYEQLKKLREDSYATTDDVTE